MEKRPRKEEPALVHTVSRREPPRNFLEVLMRTRLEVEPKFIMEKGKNSTPARTPIKKRVQKMEEKIEKQTVRTPKWKRGLGVQGKKPSPLTKQSRMTTYFSRKSPKAGEARARAKGICCRP